jgi:tripartite-type tricarboxylate transporter receptor subunit TctC
MGNVFSFAAAMIVAASALVGPARAQSENYPSRPITMIVPFVAGGPTDLLARVAAEGIRKGLGAVVVVENRPGAGGCVAAQAAIAAPADGYTVMFGTAGTHALNDLIFPKAGYDPIGDFASVAGVATSPNLLMVSTTLPIKTVPDLVTYAKANPGMLTYGSGGFGTSTHLAAELFADVAGIKLRHIPYKGTAPAVTDLTAGQISMVFDSIGTALPHANGTNVRPLAVTTPKRSKLDPNIPTIMESGYPGFDVTVYYGLFASAKTPRPIIDKLNKAVNDHLATPEVQKRFEALGLDPMVGTPEQLASSMKSEKARWEKIIKDADIRIY